MSTAKINTIQLGQSGTASQNFVLTTGTDGTMKLARGNAGATTQDILTVAADGKATLPQALTLSQPPVLAQGIASANGLPAFVVRAWATFSGQTAGTFTPTASGNVANVQRTAVGVYVVTFITPMPSTAFMALAGTSGTPGYNIGTIGVVGRSVNTVTINSAGTTGTTNVVADAGTIDLIVIG